MTQAESGALETDYEFARQSLAAAVARAYFSTIEAAQQDTNAGLCGVYLPPRAPAGVASLSNWSLSLLQPRRLRSPQGHRIAPKSRTPERAGGPPVKIFFP
jgi:hypothetical protein